MNLLLLNREDFVNATDATISGRRFEHLKKIVKVKPGQIIDIGLINGKIGKGKIIEIKASFLTISTEFSFATPPPIPVTLVLALPRPLMMKRILQNITTLGVKHIHIIDSERVEKSYWGSSDMADDVVKEQIILGLEQAKDTLMPNIYFHKHFSRFIKDDLPMLANNKLALLAHPGDYPPCPANVVQDSILAIGPEGGFIPDEVSAFINNGFQVVQLGTRPLRVEAAVTAFIGRLLPA